MVAFSSFCEVVPTPLQVCGGTDRPPALPFLLLSSFQPPTLYLTFKGRRSQQMGLEEVPRSRSGSLKFKITFKLQPA